MQSTVPIISSAQQERYRQRLLILVALAALGYGLLWVGFKGADLAIAHYLPLHTVMETMAIVVAMLGFGIAWHAYSDERPGNIAILGVMLLGTGLLDFAHTMSVLGMPDFITPASMQKSISFWLAARLLPAIGFLTIALRDWGPLSNPRTRYGLLAGVLVYVAVVYTLVLFHMDRLPVLFVAGQGLTELKIGAEYVLVALYGLAAWLFFRQSRRAGASNTADLFAAAAIAALSELCFTLYRMAICSTWSAISTRSSATPSSTAPFLPTACGSPSPPCTMP